ncbi:DNA damage-binding protein 1a-like [Raphanus sativus]|uniref:DNA damage-binding protein 1a-like n=1 Tax=Raphanus sativus TaxID=3726 RepID=A0A9W3DE28_RAPSA|nr:DNA damage-binding protein 1a-like [Raphanus sativus]
MALVSYSLNVDIMDTSELSIFGCPRFEIIYLGAENNFNLPTVKKNSEGATDDERGRLEILPWITSNELPDSEIGQIPTVIFGTVNRVIGVIASLPQEQYVFLEKLHSSLRKVIKGVGGLSHEQWSSFYNEKRTMEARSFLDGELFESFLDLSRNKMEEVSKSMNVQVELCMTVEELTRFHQNPYQNLCHKLRLCFLELKVEKLCNQYKVRSYSL